MDLLRHFWTFSGYPEATEVHWVIGLFVGFFAVKACYVTTRSAQNTLRDLSTKLMVWFIAYEVVEFARKKDLGDVDIANGGICFALAALVTWIFHVVKNKWGDRIYELWRNH